MHAPLRIAHRGMPRQSHENTLESFRQALYAGADGIELDVHASQDGVIVVHHDPTLSDGTPIATASYAELRERSAARGVVLATLRQCYALPLGRAELFVEIKGEGIELLVSRELAEVATPVAIHSFDHAMIRRLSDARTPVRLGILVEGDASDSVARMRACGAQDLWPHWRLVTAALVEAVHDQGGRIIPWTVNGVNDIAEMRALGVDGICTDDVQLMTST